MMRVVRVRSLVRNGFVYFIFFSSSHLSASLGWTAIGLNTMNRLIISLLLMDVIVNPLRGKCHFAECCDKRELFSPLFFFFSFGTKTFHSIERKEKSRRRAHTLSPSGKWNLNVFRRSGFRQLEGLFSFV